MVLQKKDGSFYSLPKETIARTEYCGHSLMPSDYEKRLSSKEIDDLVSYLLKTNASEHVSSQKNDSEEE